MSLHGGGFLVLGHLKLLQISFSSSLWVARSLPLLLSPPPQDLEQGAQVDHSKLLRTTQCISLPLFRPFTIQRAMLLFGSDIVMVRRISSQADDGTDLALFLDGSQCFFILLASPDTIKWFSLLCRPGKLVRTSSSFAISSSVGTSESLGAGFGLDFAVPLKPSGPSGLSNPKYPTLS